MQTISNKKCFSFLLCALWVLSAVAWAQPRISVHPLAVEQGPRGARWDALFMREVAKQNIAMTPRLEVEEFLEAYGGSCRNENNCLRELGYATQAHYILWGSLRVTADRKARDKVSYILNARLLMANGVEVKKVERVVERVSKTNEEANALAIYQLLFEELMLESLPPHSGGVSLDPPAVMIQEREWQSLESLRGQMGMSSIRKTSYTLLGVAGVATVAGAVFARIGISGRLYSAVFSVAATTAIMGIRLFFTSPERTVLKGSNMQMGLMPMQGGALFSIQGVFPSASGSRRRN